MLFIDARRTFRQVDRAHRKYSPKQIEYLANIVRLYRGELRWPPVDELPQAYTPDLYQTKCDTVYQHVYDSYQGEGESIYANH